MPDYVQYSLDFATTLSIAFAAIAFIWQRINEKKKEITSELWSEIKDVIDNLGNFKLEAIGIVMRAQSKIVSDKIKGKDVHRAPGTTFQSEYTELRDMMDNIKFRFRLDSMPKIRTVLEYHNLYQPNEEKLKKIFDDFDKKWMDLFYKAKGLQDEGKLIEKKMEEKGMDKSELDGLKYFGDLVIMIVGDEFKDKDSSLSEESEDSLSLNTIFNEFSDSLLGLAVPSTKN